ncbi:hypothetical protein Poli38472_000128 [Pythium oligandrum]|uniref:WW domain-containing protein n=1 Tax=Pythium oligandrum TaxID=41045 RepID=A0A8K1CBV2_PYTOL|nr:hypothetical protein Poli38472_000128 [Pythium oligandrum]|eukprot:TMW60086.1 hypothetical protein Poli38472_000128 [Pythium oligandrum]
MADDGATTGGEEWELRHDEQSGLAYYFNLRTGESSWEAPVLDSVVSTDPPSTASNWTEAFDEDGRVYYVNVETMETSWDSPPGYYASQKEEVSAPVAPASGRITKRPSTAEQMQRLNELLSGGGDDDDEEDGGEEGEDAGLDGLVVEAVAPGQSDVEIVAGGDDAGPEWMMFLNEGDGVPCYYNHITGECVWEPPPAFLAYHHQQQSADDPGMAKVETAANVEVDVDTTVALTATMLVVDDSLIDSHAPTSARPQTGSSSVPMLTPEFEDKVRRAIESVSKTPVGSSRLLLVRTPTLKRSDESQLSTGRKSRPPSSNGAIQRSTRAIEVSSVEPIGTEPQVVAQDVADDMEKEELVAESHPGEDLVVADCLDTVPLVAEPISADDNEPAKTEREDGRANAALLIQCLIRCFVARRRVAHKRQERQALAAFEDTRDPVDEVAPSSAQTRVEAIDDESLDTTSYALETPVVDEVEPASEGLLDGGADEVLPEPAHHATEAQESELELPIGDETLQPDAAIDQQSVIETEDQAENQADEATQDEREVDLGDLNDGIEAAAAIDAGTGGVEQMDRNEVTETEMATEVSDEMEAAEESTNKEVEGSTKQQDVEETQDQAVSTTTNGINEIESTDVIANEVNQPPEQFHAQETEVSMLKEEEEAHNSQSESSHELVGESMAPHLRSKTPGTPSARVHPSARQPSGRIPGITITTIKATSSTSKPALSVLDLTSYFPQRERSSFKPLTANPPEHAEDREGILRKKLPDLSSPNRVKPSPEEREEQRKERKRAIEAAKSLANAKKQQEMEEFRHLFSERVRVFALERQRILAEHAKEQTVPVEPAEQAKTDSAAFTITASGLMQVLEQYESITTPELTQEATKALQESIRTALEEDQLAVSLKDKRQDAISQRIKHGMACLTGLQSQIDAISTSLSNNQVSDTKNQFQASYLKRLWLEYAGLARSIGFSQDRFKAISSSDNTNAQWQRLAASFQHLKEPERSSRLLSSIARDESGDSIIHKASRRGHDAIVEFLLSDLKMDVNAVDNSVTRWTPLHEACQGGHVATVQLLLEKGAALDTFDYHGDSPLHVACRLGWPRVARLLITTGELEASESKKTSLKGLTWPELFNARNHSHHRAIDVATLPSLVDFLASYDQTLNGTDSSAADGSEHSSHRVSQSTSATTSPARRKKGQAKPKQKKFKPNFAHPAGAASFTLVNTR